MRIIIAIVSLLIIISIVILIGFNTTGERNRDEKKWDSTVDIDGNWGVELFVEYEDGTLENLNTPLPIMGVYFKENKVDNFRYVLSTKGTSNNYDSIDIDLSNFEIKIKVKDQEGTWGFEETYDDIINIPLNGEWKDVYTIQVDALQLESLPLDISYNLTFTPSGSITYRGGSTGDWNHAPLPSYYYIKFTARGEDLEDDIDEIIDEPGEKWIEIEFEGKSN